MPHELVVNVKTDGCDVYVGRPSKWGNPFRGPRAIEDYRRYLQARPELAAEALVELRGKVLGCHCAPKPCHADVLAELANR